MIQKNKVLKGRLKIEGVNKEVPNTAGLVKRLVITQKIIEIENKIPRVTDLVTTTVLNTEAK